MLMLAPPSLRKYCLLISFPIVILRCLHAGKVVQSPRLPAQRSRVRLLPPWGNTLPLGASLIPNSLFCDVLQVPLQGRASEGRAAAGRLRQRTTQLLVRSRVLLAILPGTAHSQARNMELEPLGQMSKLPSFESVGIYIHTGLRELHASSST